MLRFLLSFIVALTLVSLPSAAGTKARGRRCGKLYDYVSNNSAVLSLTHPTPDKKSYQAVESSVDERTRRVVMAEAARLGLTEEATRDAVEAAVTMAGELFRNAVMWGNKFDPDKFITVEIHTTREGIIISVQDEGEKTFDPFNDPSSLRREESQESHAARRKKLGKPIQVGVSEGLFWTYVRGQDFRYGYHFDDGSTVIVNVPWTFKEKY